jgi:hypothetical protein
VYDADNYNRAERQSLVDRGLFFGFLYGAWFGGILVYMLVK